MQRRRHRHRRQVGRAVTARADLMQIGERSDLAHMGDAAGVEHGRADIVDQPVLDQMLAVPYRRENLPHRERRRRMLADQAERSEEHTSELQSLMRISYAVFCLKKKKKRKKT